MVAGGERFALRVAKANFRSPEEYLFEAQYVTHLKAAGCLVPAPVKARDGSYFFEVEAPEGTRVISLLDWLDGKNFDRDLTSKDAESMGAALAALHDAGESFDTRASRPINTNLKFASAIN